MTGTSIFVAFVLLDALVLWALAVSRGKWAYKIVAMIIALSFNFLVWNALGTFTGWPTHESVPAKSFFVSALVDQPSQVLGDPGHIDLWLIPVSTKKVLLGYSPSKYEPRAYREPYSQSLEKAVINAQNLQKGSKGQPVVMVKTKRHGGRAGHSGSSGHEFTGVKSYILPKQTPLSKRGNS